MDIVLHYFDEHLGDRLYSSIPSYDYSSLSSLVATKFVPSAFSALLSSPASLPPQVESYVETTLSFLSSHTSQLPRDSVLRQCISLYGLTYAGILLLYFSVATMSYYFLFDKRMESHPRYLRNQVAKEIAFSLEAFPVLDLLTLPWFLGDVRGWSMLYDRLEDGPFGEMGKMGGRAAWAQWAYMAYSAVFFLLFTDFLIYWVHRALHIPALYRRLHKPHHKWIIPTPFASHAFHPVDGYLQSVPYHLCVYLIPIHKYMFIGLFTFVNLWSIFIHDSDMICDHPLENYINGPSHHTLHHMYFTVNYGQYFTWADKMGGSFRAPAKGEDPLIAVLAAIEQQKSLLESTSSRPSSPPPSTIDQSPLACSTAFQGLTASLSTLHQRATAKSDTPRDAPLSPVGVVSRDSSRCESSDCSSRSSRRGCSDSEEDIGSPASSNNDSVSLEGEKH